MHLCDIDAESRINFSVQMSEKCSANPNGITTKMGAKKSNEKIKKKKIIRKKNWQYDGDQQQQQQWQSAKYTGTTYRKKIQKTNKYI